MKRVFVAANVVAVLLLAATGYADHRDDGPPVAVGRGTQLRNLNQLLEDLEAIEERNEDNPQKQSRRFVREKIEVMRRDLLAMRADVESAPIVRGAQPLPVIPVPAGPVAMNEAEFAQALQAYRTAYYTSQKYVVLQDVSARNWFTVDQVVVLINETYWNSDKVKAGALLYPRVLDKKNWFKVYAALYWDSDREELRRQTTGGPAQGGHGGGGPGGPGGGPGQWPRQGTNR